ncbi:oxidoreductase, short chain dehydrogenase/reductase family protein [Oesophagostomum dentatum]|uniref:Oxidoreductase, short chain dehydrogenase/reductase family protein n=1 Tax=Oesophagostomum dentatum TaxID=61180 RepID=A0A0B1TEG3_OESDE|nr:oxidoreductase, short chain dehydrogenase/reductase family protein [Oesophagostomum dentatum]
MGAFDGRAVIVTGSSNGIGRATAQLFAREGASVTLCGRDEKALNESKNLVLAENGNSEEKIVVVRGDVREEEVMQRIVDETIKKFGRLDVLVNNAGGSNTQIFEGNELDSDLEKFNYTMDLNTKSVLRLCQLAFPHLVKTKGEVVNVGSTAGLNNGSAMAFPYYSIAKAAQDQLTRNLALYYITKGVRVNSVNPGAVSTTIWQKAGFTEEMIKKCEAKLVEEHSYIPYQCIGKPEEIAEAILFLADRKRSNYIVGHQLVIDGGASLQMPVIADGPKILLEVLGEAIHKELGTQTPTSGK